MSRLTALLLAVSCFVATGCANRSINRYTTDRATYENVPIAEVEASKARCDLRLCIAEKPSRGDMPGPVQRIVFQSLIPHFTSVKMQPTFTVDDCDISLKYDNMLDGDKAELRSVHTGEFLARFETIFMRTGALVCRALSPGSPLHARIPAASAAKYARAPAPALAPAPSAVSSGGLSAADIQRIAAAVRQDAPATPTPVARALPVPKFAAAERADDLAVVVGVETYSDIATKAPYAERDAEAFKAYVRALGVPERNIVLLTGSKAVRSALVKNVEGWLPRLAKPNSRVYFYFSGHGAPDVKTGQAYLVPWDGDPNFLEATAYPVAQLYKKLDALPVKQVLVVMDSCFSGAGGRSVLASGARPLVSKVDVGTVPSKLAVLAASASNEISGSLDAQGHGAFTWFLLEGLNAGKTTAKALHEYLTPKVQDEARRLNRDQTPQHLGADAVLR